MIFVRPPPTSKNYPMNFQCQLVAPSIGRPRVASVSINLLACPPAGAHSETRRDPLVSQSDVLTCSNPFSWLRRLFFASLQDTSYQSVASRYSSYSTVSSSNDASIPTPSHPADPESIESEQVESLAPPSPLGQDPVGGAGRSLSRSSSLKSTASAASNGTGTSNCGVITSGKRVLPLYNLAFHVSSSLVLPRATCLIG